jgi:hypothetical protein
LPELRQHQSLLWAWQAQKDEALMPCYEIDAEDRWLRCSICGLRSYNPNDVANRYCGKCHLFLDELERTMELVKLYTRSGEYVCTVMMPAFQVRAEGVMWGERFFFWCADYGQYREGLLFCVPPGYTTDPKGVDDAVNAGSPGAAPSRTS